MPERLYPCTPTRLSTWLDCPRRYRFAYLERPQPSKGAPWAHAGVGAAVHSALADWYGLPADRRTPGAGADLVARRWLQDGFRDDAQSSQALLTAQAWVRDYLTGVDPVVEPLGVERTVSAPTRRLALSGRVDRIDPVGDSGLRVVDYKTGRRPPGDDDARNSLALGVYAVAAERTLRRRVVRVELHHLPSGSVVGWQPTPDSLARKVAEAESIAADAARADRCYRQGDDTSGVFAPSPSPLCSWCDWRAHCPEGRAAAPDIAPWAGVHQPS